MFSEVADQKPTALPKKYVIHSYFRATLLKVWVIAYCIKATNLLMSGGNKRSYIYKYIELLIPRCIKG